MRLAMSWGSPAQLDGQASQALPGQAAWRHAARAAVRRHWLAIALLAAGLVLRVLALLAVRPALLFVDSVRYLYNAYGMDPVGYSGALRAILFMANLDTVAAVQHLLGLGMAVVIYLLLLRCGVSRWLAALAIAPVLLDAYQLQIEQMIMPDTWFEALIVAGLAILLWPSTAGGSGRVVPAGARPSWRRVVVAGIVLGTSATVAQVGEALILPAVIYLLAAGGGWRHAIGKAAALCAAFALPILVYCTGSYLVAGDFFLSHTGVTSLYGRTAAAVDCATIKLPAAERGMCPTKAQQAMGPDWLEYGNGSPIRPYYQHLPRGEADTLLSDFNHQVLAQQPLRLLGAYVSDVVKPFALTRNTRPGDTSIARWQFQTKYTYYPPWTSEAVVKAATARFGGGPPAVWRPVAAFLRSYQLHGGYTPGPLLAVCVLASLAACAAMARRRLEPATRQLGLACLALFASAAAVILVSDVFEFSWRYQLPALVTLVPAGVLGISVITRSIGARRRPS
jgi:Dolichyl-phosphate-mannose-protein mannosyltransferase